MKRTGNYIQRGLACLALLLLSPLFGAICLWIRLDSPGPVFFRQKRVGIHRTYFDILKFRTMRTDTPKDVPTHLLENPDRYITRSGAFLRKTSLDELPQLLNIARGEMAIVGPRPALWNQDDLVAAREAYGANDVLPGLTGWAQVHGRDLLSIAEKAKLDGYYVAHKSFWLDLACLALTARSVFREDGVREGRADAAQKSPKAEEPDGDTTPLPLVSVVVATYRRDRELEHALNSLAGQLYPRLEVILVDDNAPDASWNGKVREIVKKWEKRTDIPLIYIQNKHNSGSAASRNTGIREASGDYVTFLDDDDCYSKHKVETQVLHMLSAGSDYSITDLALYREDGTREEVRRRTYLKGVDTADPKRLLACHLMYHLTGTDTLMFRREYLAKIGGFPPIDVGDEFYLMERAILGGGRFSYLPACGVRALVHAKTDGLSGREGKIAGENALYEWKKKYFHDLKASEVRQIRMRHHLVLAYAWLRAGKRAAFVREAAASLLSSPGAFLGTTLSWAAGRARQRRESAGHF